VKQRLRRFNDEKCKAIGEEIVKLLSAGFIREVFHPEWLANPVPVKKKNNIWRMCVDYRSLNKVCPERPLHPHTSVTVVVWRPLPISAPGRPRGWPPQRPLTMWTSGNGLIKRSLHKFFVTDVKTARYKC
jgi:hypothetical protein